MMVRRSQMILFLGALFGFSIYVMIFSQVSVNNEVTNQPALAELNIHNNSLLMDSIDRILSDWGGGLRTEADVKAVGEELVKEVGKFLFSRILASHKLPDSLDSYGPCWRQLQLNLSSLPVIYIVTPTYRRPEQIPEMTRFAQTLMNVPAIHWVVVEDANTTSPDITELLRRYGIPFTHLNAQMPDKYQKAKVKPRGVSNRNAALKWIRQNAESGVIYFADDDNSYDIRLFEEMRYTKKVSMWPVGLVTKIGVSSPVVRNGKVVEFYDGWPANRKFPVDMAGFAVNVHLVKKRPDVEMPFVPGYEEDGFLKKLGVTINDIEPKANNCTTILVWHTQTKKNNLANRTMASNQKHQQSSYL